MTRGGFAAKALLSVLFAWLAAHLLFALSGCGPALLEPRAAEVPDASADVASAEQITRPRLELRTGALTGRPEIWDVRAAAFCERQPLCAYCSQPWDQNPQFCVPVQLTPFALGDWYADPYCSIHLYGLPVAQVSTWPSWAYQFEEVRQRAKVYRVRAATAAETARPFKADLYDPRVPCDRVTDNDMAAAVRNFKLYIQVEEAPADRWVPWGEAQKVLGGRP